MHSTSSDSKAGFSQLHLVSSGMNIQGHSTRITRRNVNAFLRQSVLPYVKRQWQITLQNAVKKSNQKIFVIQANALIV